MNDKSGQTYVFLATRFTALSIVCFVMMICLEKSEDLFN